MKSVFVVPPFFFVLTACVPPSAPSASSERFLSRAAAEVSSVASGAGFAVDPAAAVAASRADGGAAVFLPETDVSGGFVGWLDLPPTHACAASLPPAHYAVTARVEDKKAEVTWQEIDGAATIDKMTVPIQHINSSAPVTPMARVALGPESFLLGRWFACSDGLGHCGYAITLDADTPGCGP